MIIQVSGYKLAFTDKEKKEIKGFTVSGVITEPDYIDPSVEGKETFKEYMTISNSNGQLPIIGDEYEVIFSISEFNGEYTARPHHLKEV